MPNSPATWMRLLLPTVLAFWLMAQCSHLPYGKLAEEAQLRLAWRLAGERQGVCRKLSDTEMAALPAHMRRREVCEQAFAAYRLIVLVNQREVLNKIYQAHGVKSDRPIAVYEELPLAPGDYDVQVSFRRDDPIADTATKNLSFAKSMTLRAGEIALVTRVADQMSLTLRLP